MNTEEEHSHPLPGPLGLDFNDDAPVQQPAPTTSPSDRDDVRAALLGRLESVLLSLFPAGKVKRGKFLIGDILGSPGDSLEVVLTGEKAGLWTDRADDSGGDIFDLIGGHFGIDVHADFAAVLSRCADLLGRATSITTRKPKRENSVDNLGPATAKWDYLDADGRLLAVVYRYDPPGGKKEFRPWDARRRKMAPPEPRPLYNQPGIAAAGAVILVEGEKSAQALIDAGIHATTAMHGANAPIDKTDWSPLAGKNVIVWPDNDPPGMHYAQAAAQAALQAGAASCEILMPPANRLQGWDAADALAEQLHPITPDTPAFDVMGFLSTGGRFQVTPEPAEAVLGIDMAEAPDASDAVSWGTEDGLAATFTRRFSKDWRYVAAWGRWLTWTGRRWNEDIVLHVQHLVRGICRSAAARADSPRLKARLASASTISAVERIARSDPKHAATVDEWDADIWLLNTVDGVVNLKTGAMRAHDSKDRMTKITTATPRGQCTLWLSFLDQVTGGDHDLQAYLQRVAGYCLTGSTQEHAMFFLYGTGSNGKSVFVNTLVTILGDYAANAPMETFMDNRNDRHPTDLAGLRGARVVTATETEQGRRWNESRIKEITGGDRITARFMHRDNFTYPPTYKLFMSGNHKPAIRNVDEAMRRRMHLIPFEVTIPRERRDRQLQEKLLKERDGILAWALEGCMQWQRMGLCPPQSVQDATSEYFEGEDAMGRWIEERCVLSANAKSLTAELFNDWKQWADGAGEFVGSQRRFADLLITRGTEKWRNSVGLRGFRGIGLKVSPSVPQHYSDL